MDNELFPMRYTLIPQLQYVLRLLLSLPLLPYILWQGYRIRAAFPSLPEAQKNKEGRIGEQTSSLQMLCLGESSIAGIGVYDHRESLVGVIADTIHRQLEQSVQWTVVAKRGYTVQDVKEKLLPEIPERFYDLIVIGLGGNDTFQLSSPWRWRSTFIQLLTELKQRYPKAKIAIANMAPVKWFPAFPPLLRWLMTGQIHLLGKSIEDLPRKIEGVFYLAKSIKKEQKKRGFRHRDLFSDGVHPSKLAYEIWGRQIGHFIVKKVLS